jgi:hypothetical protein
LDLCTFLLLSGVDSDDSKAESPDIKAAVNVVKVAFFNEFGQLRESGVGVKKILVECIDGEGPFEVGLGRVVWGLVHGWYLKR